MKLESVRLPETTLAAQSVAVSKAQTYVVALVLTAILWLLGWYGDTVQSMVDIWTRSGTYTHGFLIMPISAFMIWHRRHRLAAMDLRPDYFALPLLVLTGLGWFLGRLAEVAVVQQYCLVLAIPLLIWAIVGRQIVRALAFPLLFLLFAVPFGEFLLLPLMEHTADFVILALRLTGIPVYREGLFFTLPSGSWSVVEACSGLRYLIASLTIGVLYAYLTYRSILRRALFVITAVLVPIIANWLRAYTIVLVGHLSGMQYAVGLDHLIYGWLFFGFVMLILFWVGSFWRDDRYASSPAPVPSTRAPRVDRSFGVFVLVTLAAMVTVTVWPVAAARLDGTGMTAPPQLQGPLGQAGWQKIPDQLTNWTPHFLKPQAQVNQAYAKDGQRVGLYLAYYRNQRQGAKLITSVNTLVGGADHAWRNTGEIRHTVITKDVEITLIEAQLRGSATGLLVWRWYWVDGRYTANSYLGKLLQAKSKLLGRGDDGAAVIVYAMFDGGGARATGQLQSFVDAMLPAITKTLNDAR